MSILGYDSANPDPTLARGRVAGVYVFGPYAWTREQVAALSSHGVEGVLPVVVPDQSLDWWLPDACQPYLDGLIEQAITWGVPKGAPVCLDVEQSQAEAMRGAWAFAAYCWQVACHKAERLTWSYSGALYLSSDLWAHRWLARWEDPVPEAPEVPEGYDGWQYAGNVGEPQGLVDLDVFRDGLAFMRPDAEGVVIVGGGGTTVPPLPSSPAADVIVSLPLLRRGATGEAVTSLQELLRAKGNMLAVDGDFGPVTEEAVRRFQQRHGIGVDGIVGKLTYGALFPFQP